MRDEPKQEYRPTAMSRMLSGAVAGAVSRSVTAPIDRVRILYQVNPAREFSFKAAAKTGKTIYSSTGVAGLWRGNGAALVRVVPYSGMLFCTYPTYQKAIEPYYSDKVAVRFAAGALAGATATTLTYPLDLLRARMAAHWGPVPLYSGYLEGLKTITKTEGVGALFHGLRPTLTGIVPYSGIGFMTFETLKGTYEERYNCCSRDIPTPVRLAAGGFSGLIAQSTTYPLHVVRRRMQVSGSDITNQMSLSSALATIWRSEGINGLFKGVTLTYIKGPITVALGFTFNDLVQSKIGAIHEGIEERERDRDRKGVEQIDPDLVKLSALEGLLAGGTAGCVAKTCISPADRIKICFQVGTERYTVGAALAKGRQLVLEQGFRALWRGNGATIIRVLPYSGTTYFTYDRYLGVITGGEKPTAVHLFSAGALAGLTATTLTYPLDLLRARMAVFQGANRPTYTGTMREILKTDGYPYLFAGLRPTLFGIIPYAGLSFMTFETLKASIRERYDLRSDRDIPTPLRLMAGGFAGLVAQSATYPLDIVRRRMQVGRLQKHLSIPQAFRAVLETEGIRGLYKGLSMNWVKGPVSISISFTVNDMVKAYLRDSDYPILIGLRDG